MLNFAKKHAQCLFFRRSLAFAIHFTESFCRSQNYSVFCRIILWPKELFCAQNYLYPLPSVLPLNPGRAKIPIAVLEDDERPQNRRAMIIWPRFCLYWIFNGLFFEKSFQLEQMMLNLDLAPFSSSS